MNEWADTGATNRGDLRVVIELNSSDMRIGAVNDAPAISARANLAVTPSLATRRTMF